MLLTCRRCAKARKEISRLLEKARQRNLEECVTGVLLYSDGKFMQCLEGPAQGLAKLYECIKFDLLRFGMIDLSMAFRVAGAMGDSSPAQQDEVLLRRLSLEGAPMSLARGLLAKFWSRGLNSIMANLIELSAVRERRTHSGRIASRRSG